MNLTSIDLCSLALIKLGANSISSFDEGTVEAQVSARIYPVIRDGMLSFHPWNFASVQKKLPRLAEIPIADYTYTFQIPHDCLRILSAGSGGNSSGLTYKIQGTHLLTSSEQVTITYIFRAPESTYPPFFNMALISRLAAEFCIPLTDSTSRWQGLYKMAESELQKAKLCDAQEDTPSGFSEFNLIESRQ